MITVIGLRRMNHLQFLLDEMLNIPGDFIAAVSSSPTYPTESCRRVFVAKSFRDIPPANAEAFTAHAAHAGAELIPILLDAVPACGKADSRPSRIICGSGSRQRRARRRPQRAAHAAVLWLLTRARTEGIVKSARAKRPNTPRAHAAAAARSSRSVQGLRSSLAEGIIPQHCV